MNKAYSIAVSLLLAGCLWIAAQNNEAIKTQEAQIARLKMEAAILEKEIGLTKAELFQRTDPEYVNQSLIDWFTGKLKADPDQVKGGDGKTPRERL